MKKKKINVKQALLLFVSIHIMIAWVAERKVNRTEQQLLTIPLISSSTAKNIHDRNISTNEGNDIFMPGVSIWGTIKSNAGYP